MYRYAVFRVTTIAIICLIVFLLFPARPAQAVTENVVWTNLVNATASGNTITDTSSVAEAGGVSSQSISSGDGYVEFTVAGIDGNRAAGLNSNNVNQSLDEIDYAVRYWGGAGEVWENGTYRTETTYVNNDVFRIEIISGTVRYKKNGTTFYTSAVAPTYPLKMDTFMVTQNVSVNNAVISYGTSDTTAPTISSVAASSITSSGATIAWTTNEASDTQVEYGTTTSYGNSTTLNTSLVTSHSQSLSGLSPSTLYNYRVKSKDAAGNLATSSNFTFTTSAGSDTTSPTVSITSPAAGSTVSGTISVTASASDNVGVAGVQFRIDGNNIGAEDTVAPYSFSWDTTLATNASHTWVAVARDAAGNTTTSAGVTVTVNNGSNPPPPPPPPPSPTPTPPPTSGSILFDSNWSTATGTSDTALRDGGKWTWHEDFGSGQLLSVVPSTQAPGGPPVTNVLKVLQKGSTYAANVQVNDVVPATTDWYLRYYMRNDDTSSAGDHIVTVDTWSYANLTFMRKYGGGNNYVFDVSVYGCGYTYPIGHWRSAQSLSNGQWYRFEYFIDYVDATHIQVHPRVYDSAGTLIMSDAQFRQSDYGGASWNGRSDWTLASYYAAGNNFCIDPNARADNGGHSMRNFGLGNNGQQGAANTGLPWYFAGVQIRTDTWPGPIGGSPSPTPPPPPPPPSNTAPVGTFDEIRLSDGVIRGWSYDPDASSTSNQIHIYIDGPAGAGGTLLTGSATDILRSDVNSAFGITGNHGIEYTIPSQYRNGVSHSVYLYGIDTSNSAINTLLSGSPKTFTLSTVTPPPPPPPSPAGIASLYPGDVGIENDSNVVWVEKFNQSTLSGMTSRYDDVKGSANMSLTSDVPSGSSDSQSLTINGGNPDGGHLFKQILPAVTDTLYLRYYVKYPTTGLSQHNGVWIGGYNPALTYPNPQAGTKPNGSDRFSAGVERAEAAFAGYTRLDNYAYWMNMRPDSTGTYWGNTLINNPNLQATNGQWMCVEQMLKLNTPVSSYNGEFATWVNGVKVSHLSQGSPNGTWSGGNFTQGSGTPFEGFQWRNNANLNLNYLWLQNYAPTSPNATLKYDNVVAAKSYIGCINSSSATPPPPPSGDTTPPTVSISAPAAGSTVSGTISVTASASDNVGVAGVQFRIDGNNIGAEDTVAPYSFSWDTTLATNASHTWVAVARDAAGNTTTSAGRTVTVNNTVANQVPIGSFDEIRLSDGVIRGWGLDPDAKGTQAPIHIYIDGASGAGGTLLTGTPTRVLRTDVNTAHSATGNHGFEFSIPSQYRNNVSHSIYVYAVDTSNAAISTLLTGSPKTFTLASATPPPPPPPPADTTGPTVSITSPSAGATVSGTSTTITSTASDNVGVSGVQFKLDGINIGAEDTTSPYSFFWDTSTSTNGSHNLTAVARDAAGNQTTSAIITVTINNVVTPPADTTSPTAPTSPAITSTSSTQITLTWSASTDNTTVAGYKIFRDGVQIATNITNTQYLDTNLAPSTTYTYVIQAYDGAGNTSPQSQSIQGSTQAASTAPPPPPPPASPTPTPTPQPSPAPSPAPTPPPAAPAGYEVNYTKYPSGMFIKYANNPTVYLLNAGVKYPITDWTVYQNRVPSSRAIITVPDNVTFEMGPIVGLRTATLIKSTQSPTVYLFSNNKRYAFTSESDFLSSGYRFNQVYTIADNNLFSSYPIQLITRDSFVRPPGTLFKYANNPTIYYLDNGNKRAFTSMFMFKAWYDRLDQIVTIPDTEIYPDGSHVLLPNGATVKTQNTNNYYIIVDTKARPIDYNFMLSLGIAPTQNLTVSLDDLERHGTLGEEWR